MFGNCYMHLLYVDTILLLKVVFATPVTYGVVETGDIRRDVMTSIISSITPNVAIWKACAALCTDGHSFSFYYDEPEQLCYCNSGVDSGNDYDASKPKIVYGMFERNIRTSSKDGYPKYEVAPYRQDCLELYDEGFTIDGVYMIRPEGGTAVNTWCDMTNGGWTVLQRRMNGKESFQRGRSDYTKGFGKRTEEYWLGLETIHLLTRRSTKLSVKLVTFGNKNPVSAVSMYRDFRLSGESDGYRLNVVDITSTCGNPMNYNDNQWKANKNKFTTYDWDNDLKGANCAREFSGGWWYGRCFYSNLNGHYRHGGRVPDNAQGIIHASCWGFHYSLKETVMKMKRG